jgi:DNA-binding transcriptional MerR regulator
MPLEKAREIPLDPSLGAEPRVMGKGSMMGQVKALRIAVGPAEAAKTLRISIKALRHYEKRGLLRPKRTQAGWRLYEPEELDRLSRILALKGMGFELSQIAGLLDAPPEAMAAALAAQELKLKGDAKTINEALDAVRDARRRLAPAVTLALAA